MAFTLISLIRRRSVAVILSSFHWPVCIIFESENIDWCQLHSVYDEYKLKDHRTNQGDTPIMCILKLVPLTSVKAKAATSKAARSVAWHLFYPCETAGML